MQAAEPHYHARSSVIDSAADPIVCHCLHVSEMEIRGAVSTGAVETLHAVMNCTGAGTGCTACHLRIRELLRERLTPAEFLAHSADVSPICIAR